MFNFIRSKFGPVLIGLGVLFITFVFVFSGFFGPRRTAGLHEGAVAGAVNGEVITVSDFNRELNRRIEFFKSMMGGKLNEQQIKAFGLRTGVFNELAQKKLMAQAASDHGLRPSDEEVRTTIAKMKAFQKNDRFDPIQYKQLLAANNFTASTFEKTIRDDLAIQAWSTFFRDRVRVNKDEIQEEFEEAENQRQLRYVLLTTENGSKLMPVPQSEVDAFLKDPAKLNLAKSNYDSGKATQFKDKSFDDVKVEIAKNLINSGKMPEMQAALKKLADQVAAVMTADAASDAKANAILKDVGAKVQASGWVNRGTQNLPGVGQAPDLMKDAFAQPSSIDPKDGGKTKVYASGAWWLVAVVSGKKLPDSSQLSSKEPELRAKIAAKKERQLSEEFLQTLQGQAKIERNEDILGGGQAAQGMPEDPTS